MRKNNDRAISINSPTQKKKEIVYDAKDLLPDLKPNYSFEKNKLLKRSKFNEYMQQSYIKKNSKNNLNGKENSIKFNSFTIKHKPKNKRNKKNNNEINKTNEQLNTNKISLKQDSIHPLYTCDSSKPLYPKMFSSDLILSKLKKKSLGNKDKKYKKFFFGMLKFSYY